MKDYRRTAWPSNGVNVASGPEPSEFLAPSSVVLQPSLNLVMSATQEEKFAQEVPLATQPQPPPPRQKAAGRLACNACQPRGHTSSACSSTDSVVRSQTGDLAEQAKRRLPPLLSTTHPPRPLHSSDLHSHKGALRSTEEPKRCLLKLERAACQGRGGKKGTQL